PREWFIIFRALMTLDGVGKSIGLDLNIFKILEKDLPRLVQELLSPKNAQEELMWIAKDVVNSLRIVPKHIRWFLKETSRNEYSLEIRVRELDKYSRNVSRSLYILCLTILASVCILCGMVFVRNIDVRAFSDIPPLSWIFWI